MTPFEAKPPRCAQKACAYRAADRPVACSTGLVSESARRSRGVRKRHAVLHDLDEELTASPWCSYPEPAPRTSIDGGLAHSAYTFESLDSLLAKYAALKEADIQPHVPVQHGPTTSLYYRDPDGNMVELQIDNMPPDKATQYLRGEEYSSDPLGPSFDPDAMLAALRAGTPESDLTTRSWALKCPQLNVAELLLT